MKWRYSLRWKLPSPCPGPHELASEVVEAGQPAPESIMSRWVAGAGYAVCVGFLFGRQSVPLRLVPGQRQAEQIHPWIIEILALSGQSIVAI